MTNYHSILGLKQGASKDEIRKAYRKLAFQYHPDKNPSPSAKQKFIEITEAYDALMSGKSFSFTRSFRTAPPKPKPKSEQEIRREKVAHRYDSLHKRFSDLRKNYNDPRRRAKEYKLKYDEVNRLFALSGGVFLAGIFVPILLQTYGMIIISFPLGLGFGIRLFWTAGRKKMKADMIFGKEEHYSMEELKDFFSTQTEIGNRDIGSSSGYW